MSVLTLLGAIPILIWLYLLFARGMFWRFAESTPVAPVTAPRRVAAVIPARDEAASIAEAVNSLRRQKHFGELYIFVVDDHSSDNTALLAQASGAIVIKSKPLPPRWTGKLWAVSQGIDAARSLQCDYLLLTDADIVHAPDNISELIARAESAGYDLVSYMVKLHCDTLAERALIPAFVFFFFMLYPPAWVPDRTRKTAAAAGGCILIRPGALERIGGIASIRDRIIDDCALARAVKPGGPIWLGITETAKSLREYATFSDVASMISRTAFTQLDHSAFLLVATVAGLFVAYIAPIVLLVSTRPALMAEGAAAWVLMTVAFMPAIRFYRLPSFWAPTLPAVAAFYAAATLQSAAEYWSGRGGRWKDRIQDLKQN